MLVIMHHRDVEFLFQAAFYFETFGCFDILEIDTSESGGNSLDCLNEFVGVFLVHLNIEYIDTSIYFEKQALTFHYRFASHGTYVA